MYERCISCWMSTGSMRSPDGGGSVVSLTILLPLLLLRCWLGGKDQQSLQRPFGPLDVEEPNVLGVAHDERAPGFHVLAHQHAEQLVRGGGVVQGDLGEQPVG